jgi:hypothetical protein
MEETKMGSGRRLRGERPASSMGSGLRWRRRIEQIQLSSAPSVRGAPRKRSRRQQKREEERAVLIPLNPISPDVYREGLWV